MSTKTLSLPTGSVRLREVALTICGRRDGKDKSCDSCLRKADAVLHLAARPDLNTALLPTLADVICGSRGEPCSSCWERATALLLDLRA